MTTIITRQGKGSPLSTVEMDNNLNNLNNNKVETINPSTSGTFTHSGTLQATGVNTSKGYIDVYQPFTNNANSVVQVVPSGTATTSAIYLNDGATGNRQILNLYKTSTEAGISVTRAGSGAYTNLNIYTSDILRFSISTSGAWGLAGSYGSAGQFLMSNGSSSPPTWNTVDLTTKVSKTGDTMLGPLYNESFIQVRSTGIPVIEWHRPGVSAWTQWIDSSNQYFYTGPSNGGGTPISPAMLITQDGHLWTKAYGYLTDYFSAIGHTHNYAGVNSNFDWVLVSNATIASNATLNVLSNYGYGIYYYTTSGTSGVLIPCGNGATLPMPTEYISTVVNAYDILSNSGSGSRTLYLYKLRKTA